MNVRTTFVTVLVLMLLADCSSTHPKTHPKQTSSPSQLPTTQHAPSAETSTTTPVASTSSASPTSQASTAEPINATGRVIVRPVTSTGAPATGYSVTNEAQASFSCTGETSPVAMSPNIQFCGYSATDTVACWKSAVPATVLCLRDPLTKKLVRIRYTGAFAATSAPTHPAPEALVLDDDNSCLIRDGGAWDSVPSQPTWVGWYYCANHADIYGPMAGNGIDQTRPTWTVHTVIPDEGATITSHTVTTAYFVGTAG